MKKYMKLLPLIAAGLNAVGIKNVSATEKNITVTTKKYRVAVNLG